MKVGTLAAEGATAARELASLPSPAEIRRAFREELEVRVGLEASERLMDLGALCTQTHYALFAVEHADDSPHRVNRHRVITLGDDGDEHPPTFPDELSEDPNEAAETRQLDVD